MDKGDMMTTRKMQGAMRIYDDLETMLRKETNSRIPRSASSMLKMQFTEKHPNSTAFVLFKSGTRWEVLPAGPAETYRNISQAAISHPQGGRAVAWCHRIPTTEKRDPACQPKHNSSQN